MKNEKSNPDANMNNADRTKGIVQANMTAKVKGKTYPSVCALIRDLAVADTVNIPTTDDIKVWLKANTQAVVADATIKTQAYTARNDAGIKGSRSKGTFNF